MKKRTLILLLAVLMVLSLVPMGAAAAEGDITIYLTVSDQGVITTGTDKEQTLMANVPVAVTPDEGGEATVDAALTAAHALYCVDGYAAGSASCTKLWGTETSNTLFFINGVGLTTGVKTDKVADGDYLMASINKDATYYADWYAGFNVNKMSAVVGQDFELTLTGYLGMAYEAADKIAVAIPGVKIGTVDATGFKELEGKTTDEEGKVTLSFSKPGLYVISASGTVKDTVTAWSLMNISTPASPVYGIMEYTSPYNTTVAYTEKDYGNGPYPADEIEYVDFKEWKADQGSYHTLSSQQIIADCPIIAPVCVVDARSKLASLEVTNYNKDVTYSLSPAFDKDVTTYSIDVPDYESSVFPQVTLGENTTEATKRMFHIYNSMFGAFGWSSNNSANISNPKYPLFGVCLGGEKGGSDCDNEYTVNVKQYPTLKGLAVDGVMTPGFDRSVNEYHAYVDGTKESVDITATPNKTTYGLTVNGQEVTGGQAYTLTYEWNGSSEMVVPIVLTPPATATNMKPYTYTLTLEKEPLNDAPFMLVQPEGADLIIGDKAPTLTVKASANGDLGYQWYKNTANSTADATIIEEATAASYTPAVTEVATTYYFCRVTNKTTKETTDSAIVAITVDADPTPKDVDVSPKGVALPTNDGYPYAEATGYAYDLNDTGVTELNTTYTVAEGSTGKITYQWRRGATTANSTVSGATEASYTPLTTTASGYYYACRVTNTFKGKTYSTLSNPVYVYVRASGAATPTVSTQPVGAEYLEGKTPAALSVSASRSDGGALKYQWYSNSKNSITGGKAIEDATTYRYQPSAADSAGTTYYYCKITNELQKFATSTFSDVVAITFKNIADVVGSKLDGGGSEQDPYLLENAADFAALQDLIVDGVDFEGRYFQVTDNITLPSDWTGLGDGATSNNGNGAKLKPFSGTLDGGGNTITIAYGSAPLLKFAREATVQNLNIYGTYIKGSGLLANYVVDYGTDGNYNAGIGGSFAAGCPDTINIYNVTIKSGTVIRNSGLLGGYASGANIVNISGCTVESGVKIGYDAEAAASAGASRIGSFGGEFNGSISNCNSAATVYGDKNVGGIVGAKGQSIGPYAVSNCSFTGKIIATGELVGGIAGGGYVGFAGSYDSAPNVPCANIQNCYVAADIAGADKVGGIYGGEGGNVQNWGNAYIRNNVFYGTVTATAGKAGGIVGYMNSLNVHNVIANNFYLATGADKGLGSAKYVDTSCATHETAGGASYFNSQTKTDNAPTGASRTGLQRSDDPLGADADKLARAVSADVMKDGSIVTLLNSGAGSYQNWAQGTDHPEFSATPVAYKIEISGEYKDTYYTGEKLDLSGAELEVSWSNGTTTKPAWNSEDVKITGFDSSTRAVQTLTIACGTAKTEISVTVLKAAPSANTIKVYFTLLGDSVHDSQAEGAAIHTLKDGNLTTWIAKSEFSVDLNATVKDVLNAALATNGLTCSNPGGDYVESITKGGVTLGEFSNGSLSGWMYAINGRHSNLSIEEQFLNEGDAIVFHYSDDYTKEQGSEDWGTPDLTPPAGEAQAVIKQTVTVDKGTATAVIAPAAVTEAIKAANDNGEKAITVIPTETGSAKNIAVSIPTAAAQDIVDDSQAALVIESDNGSVNLPNDTLAAIAEQAKGSEIVISVEQKTADDVKDESIDTTDAVIVDVTVSSDGKAITSFGGKALTVTIPVSDKFSEGKSYKVIEISADGKTETLTGKCVKIDGKLYVQVAVTHLSTFVVQQGSETTLPFTDVSGHWALDAIQYAFDHDLMGGVGNNKFDPNGTLDRAMLVTMLYRMDGEPAVTAENPFKDVADGKWYSKAVIWAEENDIVDGYGNGKFGPQDKISREQMATMLLNYSKYKKYDTSKTNDLKAYSDAADISVWALAAMQWANAEGLITGRTATTIVPGGSASRAEAATILMRYMENVVK